MPFSCKEHPDEVFETRREYMSHIGSHPSTLVACPLCGKQVKSKGLKTHMAMEQDPNHPFWKNMAPRLRQGRRDPQDRLEEEGRGAEAGNGGGMSDQEENEGPDGPEEPLPDVGTETLVNGVPSAPLAPSIGLKFPGEGSEQPEGKKEDPKSAKTSVGGMTRSRGTIYHRTPSLTLSHEALAVFEYAAATWPDKYGRAADMAVDLSTFVDDCIISLFRLYGIGPVIYRSQAAPALAGLGGTNGNSAHG